MSIITEVCDAYIKEIMDGGHVLADTYKIAMIKPASAGTPGAQRKTHRSPAELETLLRQPSAPVAPGQHQALTR
jgi:hypothetical protein